MLRLIASHCRSLPMAHARAAISIPKVEELLPVMPKFSHKLSYIMIRQPVSLWKTLDAYVDKKSNRRACIIDDIVKYEMSLEVRKNIYPELEEHEQTFRESANIIDNFIYAVDKNINVYYEYIKISMYSIIGELFAANIISYFDMFNDFAEPFYSIAFYSTLLGSSAVILYTNMLFGTAFRNIVDWHLAESYKVNNSSMCYRRSAKICSKMRDAIEDAAEETITK